MDAIIAHEIALVLWCAFFALIYPGRLYYLLFVLILAVVGGFPVIEYAPALWLIPALILGLVSRFGKVVR